MSLNKIVLAPKMVEWVSKFQGGLHLRKLEGLLYETLGMELKLRAEWKISRNCGLYLTVISEMIENESAMNDNFGVFKYIIKSAEFVLDAAPGCKYGKTPIDKDVEVIEDFSIQPGKDGVSKKLWFGFHLSYEHLGGGRNGYGVHSRRGDKVAVYLDIETMEWEVKVDVR